MGRLNHIAGIVLLLILVSASTASAHSPLFPEDNHTLSTAADIQEPAKSFAVYHDLEAEEASYYSFQMAKGGRIKLELLTPRSPLESGFVPGLALLGPGMASEGQLPSFVEVPAGYGSMVIAGDPAAEGELEPFSPGPIFFLATVDVLAPANGTYYAVIFSGAQGGNYAIAIGYLEEFTPEEILTLPLNLLVVYQWEGQSLLQALIPYLLVLGLGGTMAICYWKRKGKPASPAKWMALVSSLAFLGSCGSVLYQLVFTFTVVEPSSSVFVSLAFAFVYLGLSMATARFAFRRERGASIGWRVALLAIAILGLALWGGFYIGPVTALVAAILPSKFQ